MHRSIVLSLIATLLMAAGASAEPQGGPPPGAPPSGLPNEGARPPGELDDAEDAARTPLIAASSRLLAEARRLKEKDGCAAAAPTYRVVAAMGAGEEAAQHELGECLLAMTGADATDTDLFRQEGVFWLTRAAYAGNARAQRALAVTLGPTNAGAAANAKALRWALVYARNADAKVYGFKELPPTFVPGLQSALGAAESAEAARWAVAFRPVTLARFTPPPIRKTRPPPPRRP